MVGFYCLLGPPSKMAYHYSVDEEIRAMTMGNITALVHQQLYGKGFEQFLVKGQQYFLVKGHQ